MRLPDGLARLNRRVTNPVQLLWAPHLPPFAVIEHIGRRSGRRYRTPVLAWDVDDAIVVVLFYGSDRDWVRNLEVAGAGVVTRARRRVPVAAPEVLAGAAARAALPRPVAPVASRLGFTQVLRMPRRR